MIGTPLLTIVYVLLEEMYVSVLPPVIHITVKADETPGDVIELVVKDSTDVMNAELMAPSSLLPAFAEM